MFHITVVENLRSLKMFHVLHYLTVANFLPPILMLHVIELHVLLLSVIWKLETLDKRCIEILENQDSEKKLGVCGGRVVSTQN